MISKIVEVTNGPRNWGKFLVAKFDEYVEWKRGSVVAQQAFPPAQRNLTQLPLLSLIGWDASMLWILDLQTREGAAFKPGGSVPADLEKHRIWVCPLFEPFLQWLYEHPEHWPTPLSLPDHIDLPEATFEFRGYRRPGPEEAT
jgi:hypothetical protein